MRMIESGSNGIYWYGHPPTAANSKVYIQYVVKPGFRFTEPVGFALLGNACLELRLI